MADPSWTHSGRHLMRGTFSIFLAEALILLPVYHGRLPGPLSWTIRLWPFCSLRELGLVDRMDFFLCTHECHHQVRGRSLGLEVGWEHPHPDTTHCGIERRGSALGGSPFAIPHV